MIKATDIDAGYLLTLWASVQDRPEFEAAFYLGSSEDGLIEEVDAVGGRVLVITKYARIRFSPEDRLDFHAVIRRR